MEYKIKPIGYIKTKYKDRKDTPSQGANVKSSLGCIQIEEEFLEGIRDLKSGMNITVVFYFNQSKGYKLITKGRMSPVPVGVFSTRSPDRPNSIGITEVVIREIKDNIIEFRGADMLDGTPVIDIKPTLSNLK